MVFSGITPLGGFVARMLVADREYVKGKYDLYVLVLPIQTTMSTESCSTKLKAIEDLVADAVEISVPFNNYVTGFCAFTVIHPSDGAF